jgi:hypothetical protein
MPTAIIHAYGRPLVGTAPIANPPAPTPEVLPTLKDLSVTTSFNIPLSSGGYITTPSQPVTPGSKITITPNDGRLAIVAGAYARGASAWETAGTTVFTIVEEYTGKSGAKVTRTSTATITAVAPVVVVVPVTPTLAQVADVVGVYTRAGVKIGQVPAGASLTGTNAGHLSVDALGQVTIASPVQSGGLAASYNLTVVGGGAITAMTFSTVPNTWTVTNAAEIESAFALVKAVTNRDGKLGVPTGTVITSPAVNISAAGTAPENVIWRRYIELKGAKMAGTVVDANKNLGPADVDPLGFQRLVGGVAGHGLYAGLNGKQAYQWDALASVSGGSITIYCPTALDTVSGKTGGATMTAMVYCEDCTPIRFENIDFNLMSSVDMYDSKATAPVYVTREAVISVTAASAITSATAGGGVLQVSFDDVGAGYAPGQVWNVGIDKKSGGGSGFAGTARTKGDGTIDPTTFVIKAAGTQYTTASKLKVYEIRVWDPPQLTDAPQFPAYNPVSKTFGKFYQFIGTTKEARQEGTVPTDYPSYVFSKCRFGIGGRPDRTSFRVNRCINITNAHNHLVVEDCLFDYMWIGIGHSRWCRTDMRRNKFINYTNDIIDTYPTAGLLDPVATAANGRQTLYTQPPSGLRARALMMVTDNYIGKPEMTSLLMSNSHSDGHQHGAGNDLQTQDCLFAHNIYNMNATSTYMVTQGIFDNGNSTASKRQKIKFNFCAASSTNSLCFSYTDTSDPLGTLIENNFSTRTVYSAADFGSGVDAIGGAVNLMGGPEVATIRRNVIKEIWDMGPTDGGRISFNPSTGILMSNPSSIPSQTTTVTRKNKLTGQNVGPIYVSDNFFLSYLTPNTGAGNSYPEIFRDVNAIGQGPAFIWNGTLGISGPGAGNYSIGFHRWWEKVRDTPASGSWTDTLAACDRARADIQSIFTPLAGTGADGRHCFPAEVF